MAGKVERRTGAHGRKSHGGTAIPGHPGRNPKPAKKPPYGKPIPVRITPIKWSSEALKTVRDKP